VVIIAPAHNHTTWCGKKSGPLNFFAIFSATVWDFNTKLFSFIYLNLLHLTVEVKCDSVKKQRSYRLFNTSVPTDFSAFKNVHGKNGI